MGRFSRDEFLTKYPDSQNVVIPHHIYQYTYKEDISVERARQYLNLSQDAFIVTAFGKFRNREEIRMVLGAFRAWDEEHKMLLAPRLYLLETQQLWQEFHQTMDFKSRILSAHAAAQPYV